MDRRFLFVLLQTVWMLGTVAVLDLIDALDPVLFFIISYIGLLVVIEFTAPFALVPPWRRRLRWFVLGGFAVFAYFLGQRILALLPPGTF